MCNSQSSSARAVQYTCAGLPYPLHGRATALSHGKVPRHSEPVISNSTQRRCPQRQDSYEERLVPAQRKTSTALISVTTPAQIKNQFTWLAGQCRRPTLPKLTYKREEKKETYSPPPLLPL